MTESKAEGLSFPENTSCGLLPHFSRNSGTCFPNARNAAARKSERKKHEKYSKIARIAAFALAVVMLFAFAGCSGKKNNNNKNNGSGNNNGGSGENRTAPSNTPVPAPSTKTPQMNDDMKSLNELFVGIQAGTTPITGITVKTSYSNPNGNPLEFDAANIPAEQQELYNKIIDFIKGVKISFSACNWDKFLNVIGAAPERKTNEAALTTTMVEKGSDSVIYIKTESQTLALTFINDGTILLAGCTFDAGAAEGKITPSATLICGSFDTNYTMQLRSLFGVK